MTSRRPYCTKQWNGGHVGVPKKLRENDLLLDPLLRRVFRLDVERAMGQNCPLGTLDSHEIRSCTLKPREILRTGRIKEVISQPRSQGSLLPVPTSQGRVGENPGNEVGNFPHSWPKLTVSLVASP